MASLIEKIRKDQIVNTAISAIAANGYVNTPLSEIARRAGISKGVISYYFGSKDDLVRNVIDRILQDEKAYLSEKIARGENPKEKLLVYIRSSFSYMETNRQNFEAIVDLWGSITTHEKKLDFNKRSYDPCRNILGKIIREGIEKGEFADRDVRLTASIIQAMIDGMMIQWIFDASAIDLEKASLAVEESVRCYLFKKS